MFNPDEERLYLSPMFGHILISDARKVVVYSLSSGRVLNTIHYHKYKRLSKELDRGRLTLTRTHTELQVRYSASADTSPYAQTGVSIWDLRWMRLGERNVLVVVHDIERINPNIVDFYDL